VFTFFSLYVGFLPPPPPHRHSEAYFAHPDFRLPVAQSVISPTFFGEQKANSRGIAKEDVSARKTIMAIRKRISRLIDEGKGLHSQNSKMMEGIFEFLVQGKPL
jgi:hypothetical protein